MPSWFSKIRPTAHDTPVQAQSSLEKQVKKNTWYGEETVDSAPYTAKLTDDLQQAGVEAGGFDEGDEQGKIQYILSVLESLRPKPPEVMDRMGMGMGKSNTGSVVPIGPQRGGKRGWT